MADYKKLSDGKLSKILMEYAKGRKGDIADLTYAASVRIAVLAAKVKELKEENKRGEDDGK